MELYLYIIIIVAITIIAILLYIVYVQKKKILNIETQIDDYKKYKKFLDSFPVPVFYKNFEGKAIYTNPSFDISFGSNKTKTIKILTTLLSKPVEQMELNYDNDIQKRAIIFSSNLYDNDLHIEGKISTIFDIDNFKKDITSLLALRRRYSLAVEGPKFGLWDWNILENTFYSSNRWKKIMSYAEDEKPNNLNSWLSLVDVRDMAKVNEKLNQHLSGLSDIFDIEHRIRLTNGSRWVHVKGKALFNGKIAIRMTGLIEDISERKEAENRLGKYQILFASFLENLPGVAFIKDIDSKYIYINRNFENLIEYKAWRNKTPHDIFDKETATSILENDKKTILYGQQKCFETISDLDKKQKRFQVYKFTVNDENGEKFLCGFGIELTQGQASNN